MLSSRIVDSETAESLRSNAKDWASIDLTPAQVCDLELYLMGLVDGRPDVPVPTETTALRNPEGLVLAIAHTDGSLEGLQLSVYDDFKELRVLPESLPAGTKAIFTDLSHPAYVASNEVLLKSGPLLVIVPVGNPSLATPEHHHEVRAVCAALPSSVRIVLIPLVRETHLEDRAEIAKALGAETLLDVDASPAWRSLTEADIVDAAKAEHALAFPPREKAGLTVFFTGLSGSGKSTIARLVFEKLLETGDARRLSLLDGDSVRKHLSSELGFSREHRNINVLRVGYVASEVTRHGGLAICAPIAPYDEIRREVRAMIEPLGGFVLIHVATPVEVCEQRDVKGLYAKARAGILKEFTGISDPYDVPTNAEIVIDTTTQSAAAAAADVIEYLRKEAYLSK
jgi:adenylyl-sulfate kinase